MNTDGFATRSPIRWVGGKRRLRNSIIAAIPEDHECYVEPFGGAGWVLFGKPQSSVEVYNDINGELVNFFRVVRTRPADLVEAFQWSLISREEFEELAESTPSEMGEVERARRFYYLIMAGWSGEERYYRFATSIKDGGGGNRLVGGIKTLRSRLKGAHRRLQEVIIERLDWQDLIPRYASREEVVLYVDPPYEGNGVHYAKNMRSGKAHDELASLLLGSPCRWLLSAQDTEETRSRYAAADGVFIEPVEWFSGMASGAPKNGSGKKEDEGGRVKNREVLIGNYDIAAEQRRSGKKGLKQGVLDL